MNAGIQSHLANYFKGLQSPKNLSTVFQLAFFLHDLEHGAFCLRITVCVFLFQERALKTI